MVDSLGLQGGVARGRRQDDANGQQSGQGHQSHQRQKVQGWRSWKNFLPSR